jgi:hypothetical protein
MILRAVGQIGQRRLGRSVSRLAASPVRLLVPLREFQKNYFLTSIINVVKDAVRTSAKSILCSKLRHDELSRKFLGSFAFRPWGSRQRSDGVYD